MRKNAPRKWLHAILDLLPVILIPVFMIYSHRHTINSYDVQYAQNKVIDFNQYIKPDEVNISSITGVNSTYSNYFLNVSGSAIDYFSRSNVLVTTDLYVQYQHKYLLNFKGYNTYNDDIFVNYNSISNYASSYESFIFTGELNSEIKAYIGVNVSANFDVDIQGYINLFDLTLMFGAGNEPTIQQFNEWYPNDYYNYTLSHKELLKNYSTETLNDTDIMSQFTYNLYNSVDKYFNMNNIFGFNNLYDWFVLNVFNGNAPLYVYIVWNIILYEFIMDLLFLLYAVFMFLIDVCTHLIEKVFDSGRGA